MNGCWYVRWWGFSINEGGKPINLHMQWLRRRDWFFVYAYVFGRRFSWRWERAVDMADITMCTQTLCPNAGHCYRVQAKASEWQSMAAFDYTISARGVECKMYIPAHSPVATDSTVPAA